MNPLHRRGIASVVSIPLLFFACFFLLLSGAQLYAFHKSIVVVERSIEKQFPALTLASTLVRECEWIRGMNFRLSQSKNEFILRNSLEELRDRIRTLEQILFRMEQLGIQSSQLDALKEQIASFEQLSTLRGKQVAQFLSIINQRPQLAKFLRVLSEELEKLKSMDSLLSQRWDHHMHMAISHLLMLCSGVDESYGMRIRQELYRQMKYARLLLEDAAFPPTLKEKANAIYRQLISYALGEKGVLLLFRRVEAANLAFYTQGLRVNTLTDAILLNAERLFLQTNADMTHSRDTLRTWVSPFSFSLTGIIIFSLSLILWIYLYLVKYVVKPVSHLNTCIHMRMRNIKTPLPREGAGEVREMARSVSFFINRLEERESDLQQAHDSLEEQVRDRTAKLNQLSRRLISAQEEERFRLAAELHDDVGATISVVKFGIERALVLLKERDGVKASEPLAEAIDMVKGLARQLRRIQNELRPAYIDLGLINSIQIFCQDYQVAHPDIKLDVEVETGEKLPPTLRIVIFRLVQEGLNNIAKHSRATRVSLSIINTGEEVVASIRDDGCGFNPDIIGTNGRGLGLKTMRERVELSGGSFFLETAPGQGTLIVSDWSSTIFR